MSWKYVLDDPNSKFAGSPWVKSSGSMKNVYKESRKVLLLRCGKHRHSLGRIQLAFTLAKNLHLPVGVATARVIREQIAALKDALLRDQMHLRDLRRSYYYGRPYNPSGG